MEISQIITPFFNRNGSYKPTKRNLQEIIEHFFKKTDDYTSSHKKLIKNNLGFLIKNGIRNCGFPQNQDECEDFISDLQNSLQTISFDLSLPKGKKANPVVRALYEKIMTGKLAVREFLKPSVLKAVFVKNPKLLGETREFFQSVLIKIGKQAPHLTDDEIPPFESLVNNILAFMTYFDPIDGEQIDIPQYIQNNWEMVTYTIERIPLTPKVMGSSMFAFGLTSNDPQAKPILLFKGTTYPADDGFALSFLSDVNIGAAVGTYAFNFGKKRIEEWLKKSTHTNKAIVCGQSLGGSLTLQAVSSFPEYFDKADAFSPTALHKMNLRKWKKLAKTPITLPNVNVFCPENDIVPLAGFKWRKEWNVYRIFSHKKFDFLYSHSQVFFTHKKFMLVKVNPKKDQQKISRRLVAISHLVASIPIFLIGIQVYAAFLLGIRVKNCLRYCLLTHI